MDYEQKYVKALWQMKELYNRVKYLSSTEALLVSQTLENTFPELKESEDEMIRKELIKGFQHYDKESKWGEFTTTEILSWLEKQGEQKHDNKVEPKFKIEKCKWYVCIRNLYDNYANKAFCEGDIYLSTQDGSLIPCNSNAPYKVVCPDTYFRDWTIQDAKDGDVLQLGKVTAIFKEFIGNECYRCYCSVCNGEFEIPSQDGADNSYGCHNAIPATKEQHDTLMKAMADAGYTFDFEKKELKKIEKQGEKKPAPKFKIGDIIHKIGENTVFPRTIEKIEDGDYVCNNSHSFVNIKFQDDYELVEQKPSWSEEDSKRLDRIHQFIWANRKGDTDEIYQQEQDADWLMTLKPQPKQEWSEEDEQYLLVCKNALAKYQRTDKWDASIISRWLESLKDRVQPQPKQEWSEDDSWMLNVCCNAIDLYKEPVDKYLVKNWLKSLKPNHWKPSEEQMKALNTAVAVFRGLQGTYPIKDIESLYNDLKTFES